MIERNLISPFKRIWSIPIRHRCPMKLVQQMAWASLEITSRRPVNCRHIFDRSMQGIGEGNVPTQFRRSIRSYANTAKVNMYKQIMTPENVLLIEPTRLKRVLLYMVTENRNWWKKKVARSLGMKSHRNFPLNFHQRRCKTCFLSGPTINKA